MPDRMTGGKGAARRRPRAVRGGVATIHDVAARAGLSIKTVSRVVNREPNVRAETVRRVQQGLVDLLCAASLLGLAWLMWDKAGQMAGFGDVTAQLKLPLPPFVRLMSVLCAVTAAMHVWLVFSPPRELHHPGTETGGIT